MTAKVLKLGQEDEEQINKEVWAGKGNRGGLNIDPIRVTIEREECPICVRQYPISLEGREGLKPVIEELIKDGTLEPCKSPHNTPILPVKKPDGNYRLVQDLREVNKRTRARYPVVPNPYTLLSKVPPQHQWFSVVDLKDAFWACPLAEESRDIFAFEWEDPNTGRKQQLRWTKLPQGFTESPSLFGQALEEMLQTFPTPVGIQIIQYVDDLLISGEIEAEVREATIKLLNFLGEKGLRVSKGKLQFVESEVKYLGHLISKGSRKLNPERIAGILSLPPPSSKKEVRKLLGLLGYCRLWIEGYTQAVKFLYEKLTGGDNIRWTKNDDDKLEQLKLKLASVPARSLASLEKPFHLYVNVENGVAHGVLVQEWGAVKKPIAFLSKLLGPVSHGWPVCIQAIAATAILVEESRKLTFGSKLIVCTPHAVRNVLNQKAEKWLTDSRMLKYEAILIDNNDLTIETSRSLNPAQFLYGEPKDDLAHNCLEIIQCQTKVREDLAEQALLEGKKIYVDGSSRCLQGKRMSGYAIVDGENMQTIKKGSLPSNWSAQSCELYALKRALEHLAHKKGTIYTDSKYGFGVIHTFGKIWEERGLLNSKGKGLVHEGLILEVLEALKLPEEIAVVHIKGHQKGMTPEMRGNNLADQEAKEEAENGDKRVMLILTPDREELEIPKFNEKEEKELLKIGGEQDQSGKSKLPDGRQLLNKPLTRKILEDMH
uniref:ribonuclease H n=1 Tax=Cyanistes caeruleus TaxID=156563 RepID=A0A8C0U340_CYACU